MLKALVCVFFMTSTNLSICFNKISFGPFKEKKVYALVYLIVNYINVILYDTFPRKLKSIISLPALSLLKKNVCKLFSILCIFVMIYSLCLDFLNF